MHAFWLKSDPITRSEAAFTLIEVMMGVAFMGLLSASLYAGLTYGFTEINLSREEERATQILEERMEVVRLLNWDQVVNLPGFIPTSFTDCYYANTPTNAPTGSPLYYGTVPVTNAPIAESYSTGGGRYRLVATGWTEM